MTHRNTLFRSGPRLSPSEDAAQIIDEAMNDFKPTHVLAAFSGGNDSMAASHFASLRPEFGGAFNANTGIGVEATRVHMREQCRLRGWRLYEYEAPPPRWARKGESAYSALIRHFGFPGPAMHSLMYQRLKERCIEAMLRDLRAAGPARVLLVTGVRSSESARRKIPGHLKAVDVLRGKSYAFCAPLINWSGEDRDAYLADHDLPENPVSARLGYSGECLCGSFARPNEIEAVRRVCPAAHAELVRLEGVAAAALEGWWRVSARVPRAAVGGGKYRVKFVGRYYGPGGEEAVAKARADESAATRLPAGFRLVAAPYGTRWGCRPPGEAVVDGARLGLCWGCKARAGG